MGRSIFPELPHSSISLLIDEDSKGGRIFSAVLKAEKKKEKLSQG